MATGPPTANSVPPIRSMLVVFLLCWVRSFVPREGRPCGLDGGAPLAIFVSREFESEHCLD
jgi:hypothetical protein